MGGNVPMGYDLPTGDERALMVNEAEAGTVRTIFRTYLEDRLGAPAQAVARRAVHPAQAAHDPERKDDRRPELQPRRPLSICFATESTSARSSTRETLTPVFIHRSSMLNSSRPCRRSSTETLDATRGAVVRTQTRPLPAASSKSDGQPMSPSFTRGKRKQVYRYYVSAPLQPGPRALGRHRHPPGGRADASKPWWSTAVRRLVPRTNEPLSIVERIEVHAESVELLLSASHLASLRSRLEDGETAETDAADPGLIRLILPIRMQLRGGRTWILGGAKPTSRRDPVLIRALCKAHAMLQTDEDGLPTLTTAPPSPYLRRLLRLAFLAPDLQRAILEGLQPPGLTLEQLTRTSIPFQWS